MVLTNMVAYCFYMGHCALTRWPHVFEQSFVVGQEIEAEFTERNSNLPPEEGLCAFNTNMTNSEKFKTGDTVRYHINENMGQADAGWLQTVKLGISFFTIRGWCIAPP